MAGTPEEQTFWTKVITYIVGVIFGVGARLAIMHKEKNITRKDILVNTSLAFATAYFVWMALHYYGRGDMANVCAVLCGRFGDDILRAGYRFISEKIKDKK